MCATTTRLFDLFLQIFSMDNSTHKWLSYLLGPGAVENGIWLWPGGWADVHFVANISNTTMTDLLRLIDIDTEDHFQLLITTGGWYIRATPPEERSYHQWLKSVLWQQWSVSQPGLDFSDKYDQSWEADEPAMMIPEPHYWAGAW